MQGLEALGSAARCPPEVPLPPPEMVNSTAVCTLPPRDASLVPLLLASWDGRAVCCCWCAASTLCWSALLRLITLRLLHATGDHPSSTFLQANEVFFLRNTSQNTKIKLIYT